MLKRLMQWKLLVGITAIALELPTQAQIIPDTTLPANSIVTPEGTMNQIDGGTQAGGNLFHSFQEFSIPNGGEAFFNNAGNIENILTRVTGNNISNIDGLIRANGTANLFLINPNGIMFGNNAQLAIGGSFLGSTAERLLFPDGLEFNANVENGGVGPLLSIHIPIGLQMGENPGKIVVQGSGNNLDIDPDTGLLLRDNRPVGLEVQQKTLALVSADLEINGGNLTSRGGGIELGSVADNQTVSLNSTDHGGNLDYSEVTDFRDIELNQAASLDASGLGSGRIQIQSRNLFLRDGSVILSFTEGNQPGQDVNIRTIESIELSGNNSLGLAGLVVNAVDVNGSNNAGNLTIETTHLTLSDGSFISTSTLGQGNGGALTIRATESVTLGTSSLETGVGPEATGDGGNLTVETAQLSLNDGAYITSSTFGQGNAGALTIRATESVTLSGLGGNGVASTLETVVFSGATGNAGDITVETAQLSLNDGAYFSSSTFGQGNAGALTIRATESVTLSGLDGNGEASTLNTVVFSEATGDGGNITVETAQLSLSDGAYFSSSTFGQGNAGALTIRATESVTLSGLDGNGVASSLETGVDSEAIGDAGNITVETAQLTLNDGAAIFSETLGNGNAGTVSIVADGVTLRDEAKITVTGVGEFSPGSVSINTDRLLLDNQSAITADTESGDRGNIELSTNSLFLRDNSNIRTNATGQATGGNITINSGVLAALENSDISANAVEDFGGRVTIDSLGIFGTAFRPAQTPQSDITATSELGPEFSGTVQLNAELDVTTGLIELPETIVDATKLVDTRCNENWQQSEFIVTGRGGLPPSPIDVISSEAIWIDSRLSTELLNQIEIQNRSVSGISTPLVSSPTPHLVEAQGWIVNANGHVELVTRSPTVAPYNPPLRELCDP